MRSGKSSLHIFCGYVRQKNASDDNSCDGILFLRQPQSMQDCASVHPVNKACAYAAMQSRNTLWESRPGAPITSSFTKSVLWKISISIFR